MSFRFCNAPATFQKLVIFIISDLLCKSMTVYVDDFSTQSDEGSHLECVRKTLKRCKTTRLVVNPEKTYLAVRRGVLLGYVVNERGREPDPEKIVVIE